MTARTNLIGAFACAASLALAPAAAADWEDPVRVDNDGGSFAAATAADVAVGANGLATILFFQEREDEAARPPYLTRRGAADAAWSAPLRADLPTGGAGVRQPALAAAPDGGVHGAFRHTGGLVALAWPAAAAAPAVSPAPVIPGLANGAPGRVAIDASGRAYVVGETSDGAVRLAEFDPSAGAWREPVELAAAGTQAQVAANPRGDVVAIWTEGSGTSSRVTARRRLAGEGEFSPPRQLTTSSSQGSVAVADNGVAMIAFKTDTGLPGGTLIRASRWTADGFQPTGQENVSPTNAFETTVSSPMVVADPAARFTVAWLATRPQSGTQVAAAERVTGGFLAAQDVAPASAFDLAVDADGTATLVFLDEATLGAERRASGGSFGDPETIATGVSGAPRVAAAAAGQADVVFLRQTGATAATTRTFAARFGGPPPPGGGSLVPAQGCPEGNNGVAGTDADDRLSGTAAADNLFGGAGSDVISALAGDDCVRGGAGADTVDAGSGSDQVFGDDDGDRVYGLAGDDGVAGGAGDDVVGGGDGRDRLFGDDGDDRLSGGDGPDEVEGGPGGDRIFLGEGDDFARGGDGNDTISVGSGADVAFGEAGDDRLRASGGRTRLDGGDGDDRVFGGSVRDKLHGGAGADRLFGRAGDDLLVGGAGRDVASAGAGDDRVAGREDDDRLRGGDGRDRITGDAGDDRLDGGAGRDRLDGGGGDDRINAADGGRDEVRCGRGRDTVVADRGDRVARNCENVRFRASRAG